MERQGRDGVVFWSGGMNGLRLLRRKLASLVRMSGARRALMVEALLWLAVARVWLLVAPFRDVARHLGEVRPAGGEAPAPPQIGPTTLLAREVGWVVRRTADYVPFKAVCLQQAIAAKLMLRRRGVHSVMHFGIDTAVPGELLRAHAWLNADGVRVTGYPLSPDLTEIARFV